MNFQVPSDQAQASSALYNNNVEEISQSQIEEREFSFNNDITELRLVFQGNSINNNHQFIPGPPNTERETQQVSLMEVESDRIRRFHRSILNDSSSLLEEFGQIDES